MAVLKSIGGVLANMAMSLVTEKMIKKLVILLLEKLVERTETDVDNKLLAEAKEHWK